MSVSSPPNEKAALAGGVLEFQEFNKKIACDAKTFKREGTVIDFLIKAKGLSVEEACGEVLRRAGSQSDAIQPKQSERASVPWRTPAMLEFPAPVPYCKEIAQQVAYGRGLRIIAVEFAAIWLETISFMPICGQDCWVLTDASGKCAEARRIDGRPFPAIALLAERKSHSWARSRKSWPWAYYQPDSMRFSQGAFTQDPSR